MTGPGLSTELPLHPRPWRCPTCEEQVVGLAHRCHVAPRWEPVEQREPVEQPDRLAASRAKAAEQTEEQDRKKASR